MFQHQCFHFQTSSYCMSSRHCPKSEKGGRVKEESPAGKAALSIFHNDRGKDCPLNVLPCLISHRPCLSAWLRIRVSGISRKQCASVSTMVCSCSSVSLPDYAPPPPPAYLPLLQTTCCLEQEARARLCVRKRSGLGGLP